MKITLDDFKKNAVYDIVKWILLTILSIAVSSGIFTSIAKQLQVMYPGSSEYKMHIVIGGTALLLLAINWAVTRFSRNRPRLPPVQADFRVKRLSILYKYLSDNKMEYSKEKVLIATKNGLSRYVDKYRWTGTGIVNLKSGIPQQTINPIANKGVYRRYEIDFHRTLKKGDEIRTIAIWHLEDIDETAVPFMSVTIEEPTNWVSLKVQLPEASNIAEVILETAHLIGALYPITCSTAYLTANKEYDWQFKPKLLHHYEMRWPK